MIVTNQVHRCRDCGSEHIVRNGRNRCRSQQYLCHEWRGGEQGSRPKAHYSAERRAEVLRAYQERTSLRGLSRAFGISRKTITAWLKKTPESACRGGDPVRS